MASSGDAGASCPMKMADGRFMTDYRPRCAVYSELNDLITKNNLPKNSYELRMYLQQHGMEFIDQQRQTFASNYAPCVPCTNPVEPSTMLPEKYVVRCDASSCDRVLSNPSGLGDGRSY